MPGTHVIDKLNQEVAAATGMVKTNALPDPDDMATKEVAAAIGMTKAKPLPDPDNMATKENVLDIAGVNESHNPLDIPFGYEVDETSSIGNGLSGTKIKIDNSHSGRETLNGISENVLKSLLETQLSECSCKNKNRPHVRK